MKAIQVENLKKVYNPYSAFPKIALKDVSLEVEESEFICIMGTSGSGKTTLINVLSTIDDATNGKIQINLHNLITMSENERALLRKKEIGFIFQNYNLIESLRIKDNILFSLRINNIDPKIQQERLNQLTKQLNIEEILDKYPLQCSGGQQQRAAIARALIMQPQIIFADEPTGNLDCENAKELMELFKNSVTLKSGENKLRLLASNINKDGKSVFEANHIKEMEVNGKNVKVGFFGIATQETAYKTNPNNVKGIEFTSPVDAAKEQVEDLEKQGADVIVALSHVGTDESSDPTAYDVIKAVDGIDVYVDGHSHTTFKNGEKVNDTLLVSTGEYLSNLGKVEIELDENNEVVNATASLITKEEASKVTPDAKVAAKIAEIDKAQGEVLSEVIGKNTIELDGERNSVRFGETNLGNLITDAMMDETGADLAITNGGGIRASIKVGDITKGDIVSVLPFGNFVVTKQLTGAQIKEVLEFGVRSYGESLGGFPHVAGIKFVVDPSKPVGDRIISLTIKGEALDMNKTYTVATNDFTAAGGDDYPCFADVPTINEYSSLEEILANFIKTLGTVSYTKQGRILAGTMVDGVIKVEVEKEYLKDILSQAMKAGHTVKVSEEEGKTIVKIYNAKTKTEELVSILEVKDATVEDINTLVNEINKEIEDETSNPGNGDNGSNDENQGGNNSNGGNTSNNNGSQGENNSNTTKPSNPQTGDASILGFVGVGIASIAGIFANNRRRKK